MTRLWCIQCIPTAFRSGTYRDDTGIFEFLVKAEVNVTQLSSINHHGETIPVEAVV